MRIGRAELSNEKWQRGNEKRVVVGKKRGVGETEEHISNGEKLGVLRLGFRVRVCRLRGDQTHRHGNYSCRSFFSWKRASG